MKNAHSLIVFAPGANITSERNDVLLLKDHFGTKNYWGMALKNNGKDMAQYYGPTRDKIKTFINRRLQETKLTERTAEVTNAASNDNK